MTKNFMETCKHLSTLKDMEGTKKMKSQLLPMNLQMFAEPTEPTEPKITNFRTNDFVNITKMKEIADEISKEFKGMRTKENKDNNG